MNKNILLSKTFYLGLAMAVAPLIPGVGEWLSAHADLVGMIWGGLVIGLRLITNGKVTLLP